MTRAVALLSTSSTFQAYKQSCVPASCIPSLLFLPRFQAPQQVLLVLPVAKPVQVSKPRACLIIILQAAFLWLWKRSGWLCNVAETHKCTFHFIISKYTKGCLLHIAYSSRKCSFRALLCGGSKRNAICNTCCFTIRNGTLYLQP